MNYSCQKKKKKKKKKMLNQFFQLGKFSMTETRLCVVVKKVLSMVTDMLKGSLSFAVKAALEISQRFFRSLPKVVKKNKS